MKPKTLNIVFVIILMSILIVPPVMTDSIGGMASEQENRMLAARPSVSEIRVDPQAFIRQADDWFSDNIGFRGSMIKLYKQLDRLETQGQYADGQYIYLIGQEGHRYFAGYEGFLISKFQGRPILTENRLDGLADELNQTKESLEGRGISFIVMFCTDKETVYPEHYPKTIVQGPEPAQIDILTEALIDRTDVDIFNTRECLAAEKEDYLVYNKSEGDVGHWNEIGAFFVYRELMTHISAFVPGIEPFGTEDIEISSGEKGLPEVSLKQKPAFRQLGPEFFDDVDLKRPFVKQNAAFENDDPSLPTILIMCDSFGETLWDFIPQHFAKTVLIHYVNIVHLPEYLDLYDPDIVVLEIAERQFGVYTDIDKPQLANRE